jgi:tRNA pseudouridine32 synthase/23S rRNA pseudouridine746 synthase
LLQTSSFENVKFNTFGDLAANISIPEKFTFPFSYIPHPLSMLAAEMLQTHLSEQTEWKHNFGLTIDDAPVIGKMFGVLVVADDMGDLGYLAAFSGKLAGGNHHSQFVPPVFDGLSSGGFLSNGMQQLADFSLRLATLKENKDDASMHQIAILKDARRKRSVELQMEIFDQYHFLNQYGAEMSLRNIFDRAGYKNPPAGAGECAAPKLLQYAFQNRLKPISMAEFWWGASPKSVNWKHGEFYPCCQEKCAPILSHMLEGIDLEKELL